MNAGGGRVVAVAGRLAVVALGITITCLSESAVAQNLIQNPGFESGTSPWFAFGPTLVTAPTSLPHTGARSVLVQNRTATWNGVAQSVLGAVQTGTNYQVSAWVRLANSNAQPVFLTMQKTDDGGTSYTTVANGTATSTNWTQLNGGYTLSVTGTLTTLTLYLEGPAAGVDVYADDFDFHAYDWKGQANTRIEQVRRRDLQLRVVDTLGTPVPGTAVSVRQTRHQFAFGSAINNNIGLGPYAAFFKTNFEWGVMENESKWYYNEPSPNNVTYTVADAITNFCYTNGILLRGQCVFWAVDQYVQSWVTNLANPDLLAHVTNRLNSAVGHFRGIFQHWDVNNEMLHGNFFGNRLGNWVNPWMYQYTRMLDPNVLLFVNDYNAIESTETDAYKQQIVALLSSNAPINAIGAQGHFGATIEPGLTEARFDSLAQLGLPIWVTEYDSLNPDENVRADNLEALYRLAFSKSAVDGVLMWGFWAGSQWRGSNAAIVNLDWSLNAAGRRYQSLLTEWTTMTNGITDANGSFNLRGFHGSYDVVLTPPGASPTLRRLSLDPGAGTEMVTLIAHNSGPRPLLHSIAISAGALQGFLTGDAGTSYALQVSTDLATANWVTFTNLANATGTVGFSYPGPLTNRQVFLRAKLLP